MAEIPTYIPGAVAPSADDTAQRIKALERTVAELTRKDLSRANIGQGGRLRGLYGNGSESVLFGVDPEDGANKSQIRYSDGVPAFAVSPGLPAYGSREQLRLNDLNGVPIFITDEVAGYGISHPGLTYIMSGREELAPGASSGAAVTVMEGGNQVYNPVWYVVARMRIGHNIAGTSTVNFFLEIKSGSTVVATSSIQSEPVTGVIFAIRTFIRMCAIPAEYIARGLSATVKAYATTPADFGVMASCLESRGASRSFFDLNPTFT
jgi:hypothetical protein